MSAQTGLRSRKTLACTAEATAFQKAFGREMKRKVVDDGQPFVIAQAVVVALLGENIRVARFARMAVGESAPADGEAGEAA